MLLLHLRDPLNQKEKPQEDDKGMKKIAFYKVRKITKSLETSLNYAP